MYYINHSYDFSFGRRHPDFNTIVVYILTNPIILKWLLILKMYWKKKIEYSKPNLFEYLLETLK